MSIRLQVIRKRKESGEYESIFFTKPEGFAYKPGGVFDLYFPDDPSDKRVFSFASSPEEDYIMIGYRYGVSKFKTRLQNVQGGDEMEIRYVGSTLTDLGTHKNLFIAGGIGVTTFRSMLTYLVQIKNFTDTTLFYINRNEFPYLQDLEKLKIKNQKLKIKYIQTGRHGRLTAEKLVPFIEEVKRKERVVYISGPPSMVDHTIHLFESLGVDRDLLQTDSFDGYNEEFEISS